MPYRVTAGYVSAETQVTEQGGRAVVDVPRGAELPGDVPEEQVQRFLALGQIGPLERSEEVEPDEDPEDPESDGLDDLDKDALVEIAEREGVTLDGRWGADKIAAAIRDNRQ